MSAAFTEFHEVRLPLIGRWDQWTNFQLVSDGKPVIVPMVDCQRATQALTWLIENDYYRYLVYGEPFYFKDGNVVPSGMVTYYGVEGTIWYFDNIDVAMLFKLTWV